MKRILPLLAATALLLSSCASYKDIRITSFEVVSLTPSGLREVDATLRVGIDNPILSFVVEDIEGTLRDGSDPLAYVVSDQLIVSGKTSKAYEIPVKGRLADSKNILSVLSTISRPDSLKADVSLKVSLRNGIGKTLNIKDIPVIK